MVIESDNFILLDARGTIIKVPKDSYLVKHSEVLKTWLTTCMKQENEKSYYLDYEPKIVHNLLNYLNGNGSNIDGKLDKIMNELMISFKVKEFYNNHKEIPFLTKIDVKQFCKKMGCDYTDTIIDLLYEQYFINLKPIICIICERINNNCGKQRYSTVYFIDEKLNNIIIRSKEHISFNDVTLLLNNSIEYVQNYKKVKEMYKKSVYSSTSILINLLKYLRYHSSDIYVDILKDYKNKNFFVGQSYYCNGSGKYIHDRISEDFTTCKNLLNIFRTFV